MFHNMKLGKKPAIHDPKTPHMMKMLSTHLPPPPQSINWAPNLTFPMWKNDVWGDCTQVSVASAIAVMTGSAQALVLLSDADVQQNYMDESRFDPKQTAADGSNPTDQGAAELDVLNRWMSIGYQRPGQTRDFLTNYGFIDPKNHDAIKRAIAYLGGLYIGLSLPGTAMNGTDWTVVQGATIAGGHAVYGHGYDSDWIYLNSWGEKIRMSWDFLDTYCDEAYGLVSRENWIDTLGESPEKEGVAALLEELNAARAA